MELTDRSRAIYDGLDRPWDQAANWLFAARAAISARDQQRSVEAADEVQRWLRTVEDPWLHVRGEAILGELARLQHRFDDAVLHLGRAAERSRQLGFQQTEAYQLTNLGRAQCQAGDYVSWGCHPATRDRESPGHRRHAAGRARPRTSRSGSTCARTDRAGADSPRSRDRVAPRRRRGRAGRARRVLAGGHGRRGSRAGRGGTPRGDPRSCPSRGRAPVEVFALDALARIADGAGDASTARDLCEAADRRMEAASHFITDRDRTDAHHVRRNV